MKVVCDNKKVLFPILLLGIALSLSANENHTRNTYYSEELRAIAVNAKITAISDTLSDGTYYGIVAYKKRPLTIIVEDNEVKHIGFNLFSPQQRTTFKPLCCNFIERYALLLKMPMEQNRTHYEKMNQDRVFFRTGSFDTIEELISDTALQIKYSILNNINFFTWVKNGRVVCELGFPSSYKLLLGMEMDELDSRLKRDILKTKVPVPDSIRMLSKDEIIPSITHDYFVRKGSYYYFAELNSDNYYQSIGTSENKYSLMFNSKYPRQSLANVMTTCGLPNDFMLRIKQEVYGNKDSIYIAPLTKYVEFCLKNGCSPYFCVIKESNGIMDCELIMRNEMLQYNHVMRLKVETKEIKSRKGVIDARLDAYVPTHYLKNLFNEIQQ